MIARVWTARATESNAQEYRQHFERHVLPALRSIDGYVAGSLLTRPDSGAVEILVLTRWRSLDAIQAFAGTDLDRAVVADEAAPLFISWDERVRHYAVETDDPSSASP